MVQTKLEQWNIMEIIDDEITQAHEVEVMDDGKVALAVFWSSFSDFNGGIETTRDVAYEELCDVEDRVNLFDDSEEADEKVREVLELGEDFGDGCFDNDCGYLCAIIG